MRCNVFDRRGALAKTQDKGGMMVTCFTGPSVAYSMMEKTYCVKNCALLEKLGEIKLITYVSLNGFIVFVYYYQHYLWLQDQTKKVLGYISYADEEIIHR